MKNKLVVIFLVTIMVLSLTGSSFAVDSSLSKADLSALDLDLPQSVITAIENGDAIPAAYASSVVTVSNEAQLRAAFENPEVTVVMITNDIQIDEPLELGRSLTVLGLMNVTIKNTGGEGHIVVRNLSEEEADRLNVDLVFLNVTLAGTEQEGTAIRIFDNVDIAIHNAVIKDVYNGIQTYSYEAAEIKIENSQISGAETGLYLNNGANTLLEGTVIDNCQTGITLHGDLTAKECVISNSVQGLFINPYSYKINVGLEYCTLSENSTAINGMFQQGSDIVLEYTEITNSNEGSNVIYLQGGPIEVTNVEFSWCRISDNHSYNSTMEFMGNVHVKFAHSQMENNTSAYSPYNVNLDGPSSNTVFEAINSSF